MASDTSVRKSERIKILGELAGEVMIYQPMVITEISQSGAQIETVSALQLDSLHEFRLMLGDRSVVVKGRVVHSHVSEIESGSVVYRAGIEYVEPSTHVVQAIGEFIASVRAGRDR